MLFTILLLISTLNICSAEKASMPTGYTGHFDHALLQTLGANSIQELSDSLDEDDKKTKDHSSKRLQQYSISSASAEMTCASSSEMEDSQEIEVDYEDETALAAIPAQINPRHAKLIFDGATSIRAISSALHAETAATYFSLYKTNSYTFSDHFEGNLHPFLSVFYQKKDQSLIKKIMIDQGKLYDEAQKMRPFVNFLLACNCSVKISDEAITPHPGIGGIDSLHQKIYLFQNAYRGEPVCFIGSHNPTDNSFGKQENSMVMISGHAIFTELKKHFLTAYNHYATLAEKRTSKTTDALLELAQDPLENTGIIDVESINDAIELDATTEIQLLTTPLAQTPGAEILNQVVELINAEEDELYFIHYRLTHAQIAKALVQAANRGVRVHVLIDSSGFFQNGTSISHLPAHLALAKLLECFEDKPACSCGIIYGGFDFMLHEKTLACAHKNEGLVVVGSWNATGNSTYNCCETSIVCKNNNVFFDSIKEKFERLTSHTNKFHLPAQRFIMNNSSLQKDFSDNKQHKKLMTFRSTPNSYTINGWAPSDVLA